MMAVILDRIAHRSSLLAAEIPIAKLKNYKSLGDQVPAGLIQARSDTLLSAIHKLINLHLE
jgi:hypothetical protein